MMATSSLAIDLNLNPSYITSYDTSVIEVQSDLYDEDEEEQRLSEKEIHNDRTVGDISRISNENKRLKKMLMTVFDNYKSLQTHVKKLIHGKQELSESNPKKRKFDDETTKVQQSLWKRSNVELPKSGIQRVCIPTDPSDKSLVVKDEYQWRKYGQKVTRDNPSPRAYYKCSFAPSCPVKKKVQRSVDDAGVVVATYEGEHNHRSTRQEAIYARANEREISTSERRSSSPTAVTCINEVFVQQMATYLSNDPNFATELAAAITSKISEGNLFKVF